MAEDKKGFILYADQIDLFSQLPNDKAGELIKHIFAYVNDEQPKTDDLIINLAFTPIKKQFQRDLEKWEKTRKGRSDAGKASAEARRIKKEQELTNSTNVKSVEDISTNPTVSVNDTVTVNVNDNVSSNTISLINEKDFELMFNRSRYFKDFNLKMPMNTNTGEEIYLKLTTLDKTNIIELARDKYTMEDAKGAIIGLMNSNMNRKEKISPKHMLKSEYFVSYLDAYNTGIKVSYDFNKTKTNAKL